MAEINYNNLYNQLSPMEQRYYDQQFSKNYVPGQENIMLSSQPAYEQMKAVYDAQQQVPEKSFFDFLNPFSSASAAEMPQVPNLSYRNITPTFNLGTGITNTTAATPVKIGIQDILSQYNVPGLRSQDLQNDLAQQIVEQNRQKVVSDFINAPQDYYPSIPGGITDIDLMEENQLPYSGVGDMRYLTPRTIADQNRILGQTFTPRPKSFRDSATLQEYFQNRDPLTGIMNLFRNLPTPMNILRGGLEGIRSLNERLRNTTFGKSATLADYFQARRDQKSREAAANRGAIKQQELARQTALQQMRSDDAYGGGGGGIGSSYGGSASPGSQGPGGSDEMGSF